MGKTKNALDSLRIGKAEIVAMSIKEELNRLFYLPPKYDEELEMLKYQYDHEEEERLGLHASSITKSGNFCYREQMINIMYKYFKDKNPNKIPKPIYDAFQIQLSKNKSNPIHLARIFEEGKSIGTKWQRLFIRAGIAKKENLDVSRFVDEYDLSYTPDGIIELNGHEYVVEIKSQNTNEFQKSKSHPTGLKQLKLYMYFENIERGFVLVEDKNKQDFKVLPIIGRINESDEDMATYLDRLERLQRMKRKMLKTKKMPPCPCKKCSK